MGTEYRCTGCQADLTSRVWAGEALTHCPHCGVRLDASSVSQAKFAVALKILGVVALLFGVAAGIWGQRWFFPEEDGILPGLLIALSVAALTVGVVIFASSGKDRWPALLIYLLILAVLAILGAGIWYMAQGLALLLNPLVAWIITLVIGFPLLLMLLIFLVMGVMGIWNRIRTRT